MLPLYQRILGDSFSLLPASVQELHTIIETKSYRGKCDVFRGKHWFCRLVAYVLSLPKAGKNQDIVVSFIPTKRGERWNRQFSESTFNTEQWSQSGKLYERAGMIVFMFRVVASIKELRLELEQVYFLGIPVAFLFKPNVFAVESEKNSMFHFSIDVSLPYFGRLIKYSGSLSTIK